MDFLSRLTVGDVAAVEEMAGVGLGRLGDEDAPKGKMLAAMVYVIKRKDDSDFTFQDALDMSFTDVTDFLGMNDDDDPKED